MGGGAGRQAGKRKVTLQKPGTVYLVRDIFDVFILVSSDIIVQIAADTINNYIMIRQVGDLKQFFYFFLVLTW